VTYPDAMYGGPQQSAFVNTIVGLTGINHYKDLNGGTPNCVSITPLVRAIVFESNQKAGSDLTKPSSQLIGMTPTTDPLLLLRIYRQSKASAQIG
jgi:hypothetical protein